MKTKLTPTQLTLSLATLIIASACVQTGTNESSQFKLPDLSQMERADFNTLHSQILAPKCVSCHSELEHESGVLSYIKPGDPEASPLYLVLRDGRMPRGGAKLRPELIDLVRDYILAQTKSTQVPPPRPDATPAPSPSPTPSPGEGSGEIALGPNYVSLRRNLFQKSCLSCHGQGNRRNLVVLETYEQVRDHADGIDLALSMDTMPPSESRAPRPSGEIKAAFSAWIDQGFPKEPRNE